MTYYYEEIVICQALVKQHKNGFEVKKKTERHQSSEWVVLNTLNVYLLQHQTSVKSLKMHQPVFTLTKSKVNDDNLMNDGNFQWGKTSFSLRI